jgi:hypothetical protein
VQTLLTPEQFLAFGEDPRVSRTYKNIFSTNLHIIPQVFIFFFLIFLMDCLALTEIINS